MDDAERVREAAGEALADIEPTRLRGALTDRLVDAEMTPGVLTLVSARALDPETGVDAIGEHAAGVQLIYEGLRLTRGLAREEPWSGVDLDAAGDIDADLDVLAADVFVARGFYLLARTGAAEKAVDTVRAFGRDQTLRRDADDGEGAALDRNLEADVLELAVVTGTAAVGALAPAELLTYAADLARDGDDPMPPERALPDSTADRIAALAEERVASSADS
ncbi:DUF7114 family protein [Candidatus Halobonum tyrrellensis]|uniref:Polyprenyl synthetase n=1 Tax=Candidatus Halobonum tyrrellensis G22 TaxID=1324957 RepID=V4HHI3_9EURY|nr:hypothetical protein [Candidatus Halobonum tyrrellensis]ESP87314.1 hypothetical protein K933_14548 [Candidatus Halobonum tyrrellensis G22]